MASTTPARKGTTKGKNTDADRETDVNVVSRSDDGETFVAELFGETEFTFSTDMNSYLVLGMTGGDVKAPVALLHSLLEVVPEEDEDIEVARRRVRTEFDELMGKQRKLTFERLYRVINDIMVAAGNETTAS